MSSTSPKEFQASLGERLREMRKQLGFTQPEFAELLSISDRTVKNYEADATTIPSNVVSRMIDVGIDLGYLFTGAPPVRKQLSEAPDIDLPTLREIVEWVDGEWASDAGKTMSDLERIEWILREYLLEMKFTDSKPDRVPRPRKRTA